MLAIAGTLQETAMPRSFSVILLPFAVLAASFASAALAAETSVIVDTAYVAEAIKRNAIVWDARGAAAYRQGHIPGAVNVDDVGAVLREENTEDYIATEDIERILGAAGIDPSPGIIRHVAEANASGYFGLLSRQYLRHSEATV